MDKTSQTFLRKLRGLRLMEGAITFALLLLRLLALGIPLLMLYVWTDAHLALPENTRHIWNLLLPALCLGVCLIGLRPPGSLSRLALRLDRFRKDPRRTLSCALDLATLDAPSTGLHTAMRDTAIRDGTIALRRTPSRAIIPYPALLLFASLLLVAASLAHTLAQRHPDLTRHVLSRLRDPGADLAPWTTLEFEFVPETPSVVYGGDVQVGVRIRGGELQHPVMLQTRIGGVLREAGCFREQDDLFTQRLEQVTQAVEYRFTIGRILSPWREVEVQTLPRVSSARLQVLPPAYSAQPVRSFAFGERSIEALTGSELRLSLESNRPLSGGELTLVRGPHRNSVRGHLQDDGRVEFRWLLEQSADISVQIHDIQGHGLAAPLRGSQRAIPDQRPLAVITEPSRFTLATPDTRLRVQGYGSDDIGVTRLNLVRGMSGFIDRPALLWEGEPQRRQGFQSLLNLHELGAEAGQVLELYLEAMDHRPLRPELGVSDMIRVQIITHEEYALHLRNREKLDGFRERFALRSGVLNDVADAFRELHAVLQGEPSIEEVDAALARAASVLRRAEAAFAALEEDFPIFDLEEEAVAPLRALREHFGQQAEALEALSHRDPHLDQTVEQMAAAFLERQESFQEQQDQADAFLKLGALFEQTVAFQRLIQRQETLERAFARYAYSLPPEERERLQGLESVQRALAEDLAEWVAETRRRADDLPNEFQSWREEVDEMLRGLEASKADTLMRGAADSALNEANRQAWQQALAALEALRNPPPEPEDGEGDGDEPGDNTFGQMCRGSGGSPGSGPGGSPGSSPGNRLGSSLDQLLQALRNGLGQGSQPGGEGGGPGGFSDDGFAVRGSSTLDIPLLGPNRMNLKLPRGQAVDGYTLGQGVGGTRRQEEVHGEAPSPESEALQAEELRIHQAPEKYREAIRRYFDL